MDEATMKGPVPDPWRHRSDGMRCKTCMWFVPKDAGPAYASADPRGSIGRCRRHAPTMGGYPVVFEKDWCGDHKLDESKLPLASLAGNIMSEKDRLYREYSASAQHAAAQKAAEDMKLDSPGYFEYLRKMAAGLARNLNEELARETTQSRGR